MVQSGTDCGHRIAFCVENAHLLAMTATSGMISDIRSSLGLAGPVEQTRVVVAMSGGVDSSVAAGLVKAAGFDTVGITLQLYDHGAAVAKRGACCAGQDIHDARRVASDLGIPHYVLDFEDRFRETVIDDFADSYLRGETPVPCIRCNQTVKFADLLARARDLGASALVTGHYIESRALAGGRRGLYVPADVARDQSYFLFATTQDQADFLRFPLGSIGKAQTRALAAAMGLAVAEKPDSQDICFVPEGRYADLVLKLRPEAAQEGEIVHVDGRVVGRHAGVIHYTIGQRRGLGVDQGIEQAEPLYVIALEPERARVVVGPRAALRRHALTLGEVNWLGDVPLDETPRPVMARIRSTRAPVAATVRRAGAGAAVDLAGGEEGVSPGQACVFYDGAGAGARLLGGGFIRG
jgi:tRNA-specific 2-thiouridylase